MSPAAQALTDQTNDEDVKGKAQVAAKDTRREPKQTRQWKFEFDLGFKTTIRRVQEDEAEQRASSPAEKSAGAAVRLVPAVGAAPSPVAVNAQVVPLLAQDDRSALASSLYKTHAFYFAAAVTETVSPPITVTSPIDGGPLKG